MYERPQHPLRKLEDGVHHRFNCSAYLTQTKLRFEQIVESAVNQHQCVVH